MIFSNDKPIYLQLADRLCDDIISNKILEEGRVPSVREQAVLYQVNINTAMKAYEYLSREGIIITKRGLGYYVEHGAKQAIIDKRKEEFLKVRVPEFVYQMKLLGINLDEIKSYIQSNDNL